MNLYQLLGTEPKLLQSTLATKPQRYLSFPIKKSSGKLRWLDAPEPELKLLQTTFLKNFLYHFAPHPSAVGFRVGVSVKDGANQHLGNKVLLCMDLQNFFNSINYNHVIRLLYFLFDKVGKSIKDWTFTTADIELATELVTYHKALPQGAPTSPALANLVLWKTDKNLSAMATSYGLIYTRYADDLAFSHTDKKYDIGKHIKEIGSIVHDTANLAVNKKKTRIMRPHRRMSVTGVVINDKLSISKRTRRELRARLHNLKVAKKPISADEAQVIRGHCEWIRSINPQEGQKFMKSFSELQLIV